MRSLWAILAGMVLLAPVAVASPAVADTTTTVPADDAATRAAQEIAAARERANAAADALFDAESDLDGLELQQQALQNDIDVLQQQIDALRETVEQVAINRFTRASWSAGGGTSVPFIVAITRRPD